MGKNKYCDEAMVDEIVDSIMEKEIEVNPKSEEIPHEVKKETKAKPSAETEVMDRETKTGTIKNAVFVNVRKEPDPKADVLEILRKGDKVRIHEKLNNGFHKVSTSTSSIAYIHSDFIEED